MRAVPLSLTVLLLSAGALLAQEDHRALERDILKQLVEINTSDSARHTDQAAKAIEARLADAGIPQQDMQIIQTAPGINNLIVRYRGSGSGGKPILLMAHMDVVDARREDWSFDPFTFREQDGYYYGRGSNDDKSGVAVLVANFIRYKKEGFVPNRDLIIVLTGDEETTGEGIEGLVEKHRDLIDAAYALNTDGGGGELQNGKPVAFSVQTAEKVYLSFQLEVRNKGGHSSLPVPDNSIYRLSNGLVRLSRYTFPVKLNPTTREAFLKGAANQPPRIAADMRAVARNGDPAAARRLSAAQPYYNAQLRTTCVATRLFGGHADNALPQLARATVNCRMLPNDPPDSVEATLRRVLADTAIHLSQIRPPTLSPASPLTPEIMQPVTALANKMWPQAVVLPEMSTGASDGLYVRNAGIPTYGVAAVFGEIGDDRSHGRDERIGVKAFHDAAEYWYQLVKTLASAERPARAT
jgi:acetylornithine deacetylase/succinyl-diaminopimelate desuccinylase-like protein